MPSGAKKRKAAKKKKGNLPNNNPTPSSSASTQTHGGGDYVKHYQDDKDSDGGEISSPASQDHHNSFSGGEEEEEEEEEVGEKIEVIDEPREIVVVVEESFVPDEREFEIENESDKNDGKFEHDEISSKPYDDGGSSRSSMTSSNCSLDDETHEIKKNQAENIPLSGEKAEKDMSSQPNNSIEESELEGNGEKSPTSFEDNNVGISEASLHPEETIIGITECTAQETDDRLSLSYNAPIVCADHGVDHEKDSGVSEPLLAPARRPEQKTSWKSCCGLFEVFTGSS